MPFNRGRVALGAGYSVYRPKGGRVGYVRRYKPMSRKKHMAMRLLQNRKYGYHLRPLSQIKKRILRNKLAWRRKYLSKRRKSNFRRRIYRSNFY